MAARAVFFFVERQAGRGSLLAARAGSGREGFENESKKKGGRFAARWMKTDDGSTDGTAAGSGCRRNGPLGYESESKAGCRRGAGWRRKSRGSGSMAVFRW